MRAKIIRILIVDFGYILHAEMAINGTLRWKGKTKFYNEQGE